MSAVITAEMKAAFDADGVVKVPGAVGDGWIDRILEDAPRVLVSTRWLGDDATWFSHPAAIPPSPRTTPRPCPDGTRPATGYAIGGTPPFGHDRPLRTVVDTALMQYERVWAAAGTPETVFEIRSTELVGPRWRASAPRGIRYLAFDHPGGRSQAAGTLGGDANPLV